jgi:UDPglucose 6-dehydrogenase
MKVTVFGLWHLGCVTAACTAKYFPVTGLELETGTVARLNEGLSPILEPGLNELIVKGQAAGDLVFTTDPKVACAGAEVLWVTFDTPVNEEDESDVTGVLDKLRLVLPELPAGALVLISAQLPVGTCAGLEKEFPQFHFACSPENLRLGKAIEAFENADRVIVGIRNEAKKLVLEELFAPFTRNVLFMRTESAEMVKHALNSFLALSITFINEVARLCDHTGADAKEVSLGLKSEPRIGPKAYLLPGGPFAGGTLARDVVTLTKLAATYHETISVIPAIKQSNDGHRHWALGRLQARLGKISGHTIAILGLTYTTNTDTLRRSAAVELAQQLLKAGAQVRAFDPAIKTLSPELAGVELGWDVEHALSGASAAVICTEWPQFRQVEWEKVVLRMERPLFVDANRFLEKELKNIPDVEHLSVGRA